MHELLLLNTSIWCEFPKSHELLLTYTYCRFFSELSQRPALLHFLAVLLKLTSFSDQNIKDSILNSFCSIFDVREDFVKRERFATARMNDKMVDNLVEAAVFSDSKLVGREMGQVLEAALR